jgi:hypothetical protein
MLVELAVVRVNVVAVPVQGVVLHAQVVAGEVAGRVAEIVILIPEDAARSRWRCYDPSLYRQLQYRYTWLRLITLSSTYTSVS